MKSGIDLLWVLLDETSDGILIGVAKTPKHKCRGRRTDGQIGRLADREQATENDSFPIPRLNYSKKEMRRRKGEIT